MCGCVGVCVWGVSLCVCVCVVFLVDLSSTRNGLVGVVACGWWVDGWVDGCVGGCVGGW